MSDELEAWYAFERQIVSRFLNCGSFVLPDFANALCMMTGAYGRETSCLVGPRGSAAGEDDGSPPYAVSADGVATIRFHGESRNHETRSGRAFGFASYKGLETALSKAQRDAKVRAILLDIDSPGGEAAGAMEAADSVRQVSASKKVVAFVDSMAASAGYAIAAGAAKIVVAPSAVIGSIGVVWIHFDRSAANAKNGVKPTFIHAGAHKVDGNSMQPLADEVKARIQRQVDDLYTLFIRSVGKHRPNLREGGARKTEAAMFMGQKAVDAKLADAVGTRETALNLLKPSSSSSAFSPKTETYPMRNIPSASLASPIAPTPGASTQTATEDPWSDVTAKLNRTHGLVARPKAATGPWEAAASHSARQPTTAPSGHARASESRPRDLSRQAANDLARQQGFGTQAEIDASWTSCAQRLNATLPAGSPGAPTHSAGKAGAAADWSSIVADLNAGPRGSER